MARPPADDAFTEFVTASWPSLYRTAYLLVGDRGLAEDLVQTALAKTYASWGKVRDPGAARGYARTTLVNTATSWFRARGWRHGSVRWWCCASTRTCPSPRPRPPSTAPRGRSRARPRTP